MLQNMKIKNRLNFAFGIMILFTLITAFIGLQGLKQANEHLHEFIERQYEADTAARQTHECISQLNSYVP